MAGFGARRDSEVQFVQAAVDVAGEVADQPGELAALGGRPAGQQPGEPAVAGEQEFPDHPTALGGEPQLARPGVIGVLGPADQAQPFELLAASRPLTGRSDNTCKPAFTPA
jgi:hypothetical protein